VSLSQLKRTTALLLTVAILLPGCAAPNAHLQYLIGDEKTLSHYRDFATSIEYPIEDNPTPTNPDLFKAPRSIRSLEEVTHRRLTLDECIRIALSNAAIIREDASFGSPANALMSNPDRVASVFDSAIQETGFLFGNRGVEAALSDFDALLTNNMQWGRSEDPQNSPGVGISAGETLTEESAQWSARIEKPLANAGTVSVQHDWNYSGSSIAPPSRLFQSAYTGFVQAEYRQPLLQGSGTDFTRISGPLNQGLRGVSGVSQGVAISRINSDISLVDFEQSVASMIRDVERIYWDLYLAMRLYDSEIETFKDLVRFSDKLGQRESAGDVHAQSVARLYEADARIKGSLADVLSAETRLRRLLGLPLNDGQFLTPADHPSEALLQADWESTLNDALVHRPELRKQKWNIRSLELQLRAGKSLARPRLDFVSQYRVNGFGDNLFGQEDDDGLTDVGYGSAYESITQGLNTTWNLGFSFSMPLGLRLSRTLVRNLEIRLTKARTALSEQEKEVAFELADALLNMDRWYELADSSTRRISVAEAHMNAALANADTRLMGADAALLGRALDAKVSFRDAEQAYLQSIVEYNKAIVDLNFRKGTLLPDNSIRLAEGEWNPGAYEDARIQAEKMTHGSENTHLRTTPLEFVAGPAASAWESGGDANRPFLHSNGVIPTNDQAPTSQIPEVPVQEDIPKNSDPSALPQDADPIPDLKPVPQPAAGDSITQTRHQTGRVSRLPKETAGRVKWAEPPDRTERVSKSGVMRIGDLLKR
jgi:Outer membrane efflux protein